MNFKRTAPIKRFLAKILVSDACWEWKATLSTNGYSQFWNGDKLVPGHRWAYEFFVGPIPDGLEIDHLCRNRWCVRPDHLEPVTRTENMRRAPWTAVQMRRETTHCPAGHEYTNENTYIGGSGSRFCRACMKVRGQAKNKGTGNVQARKTHCPSGHPYDEENTSHRQGRRVCKTCRRTQEHARRQRVRSQS